MHNQSNAGLMATVLLAPTDVAMFNCFCLDSISFCCDGLLSLLDVLPYAVATATTALATTSCCWLIVTLYVLYSCSCYCNCCHHSLALEW